MEIKREEIDWLKTCVGQRGWEVYMALLQDRENKEKNKLVDSRKSDNSYAKLCGIIKGLQYAQKIAEDTISEFEMIEEANEEVNEEA